MYSVVVNLVFCVSVAMTLGPVMVQAETESYAVVQARVQALEAKVHSAEAEIQKLITDKQQTNDVAKQSEIIRTMLASHHNLKNLLKEYDQQRSLLKYRYPEKMGTDKREYERIELRSIEDMEKQVTLGSSLKKTLKKVKSQYGVIEQPPLEATPKKKSEPALNEALILRK